MKPDLDSKLCNGSTLLIYSCPITSRQSVYRPFHSTEKVSLLLLLDLSAAFDTVDHQILLSDRFTVANNALTWFTSYFTDRTQQFMNAGSCTSSSTVDCSVPQGSVSGPMKFVPYTEDIVHLADEHDTLSH